MFEDFIKNVSTDRYHLMCSMIENDKQQPLHKDEEIIIGDRPILNNSTTTKL